MKNRNKQKYMSDNYFIDEVFELLYGDDVWEDREFFLNQEEARVNALNFLNDLIERDFERYMLEQEELSGRVIH